MGYESAVDRAIREAAERGAFDNLPGAGKPLPGLDGPDDEMWWVRRYVEREGLSREALLPESIQLRKEIDRLPATLSDLRTEQAVRDVLRALNLRIVEYLRNPVGPRVKVGRIDADDAVARWRAGRAPAASPAAPAPPPPTRNPWWRRRRPS
ncbi:MULTISPECIES: DUF1992 domain-containing protein [unclassified Pseudonocardia]|uniref:DnaJ family domain-containing protein n=1 Tax=unclassified Pseudonocardia TaxID=2619320 RepID=UPI0009655499|nr:MULTISPECIES: DUF1992 domain-containing protein [unclassified Pseudonocardia]MBN9103288.1 DUF1992 domain-containing protein [Pseudonocardia sp.]OJY38391.1 MAG: molecular chaperone DnaJ [Pseudonocardia sp. 73-21]